MCCLIHKKIEKTTPPIVDAFRHIHPDLKQYTWRKPNSNKMARLDYLIVSNSLMDIFTDTRIKYGHRSDHSIIELTIQFNKFKREPGTWKFNSSLLKNKTYPELINQTIDQTILEYANPIHNFDTINNIYKDINFTIDDTLCLDTLLMKIRGKTITFSAKEKRNQFNRENEPL